MLEQLRATSPKGVVLNVLLVLFNFLAWVATCVAFSSPLFHVKLIGMTLDVYWNEIVGGGGSSTFAECDDEGLCPDCLGIGRAFLAFQVFAFLGLLAVLVIEVVRICGFSVAYLQSTRKCLFLEQVLGVWNTLCFFISIVIFGAGCYGKWATHKDVWVTDTGFGYIIACLIFLVVNLVLVYMIRGDSTIHLGSESASTSDYTAQSEGGFASYGAAVGYQSSPAAATGSPAAYNGDIMPAQTSQV